MSTLARDGTAKSVSETKFSGTYGDRGISIFPVQLTTSRIGNLTRSIHTLMYIYDDHSYASTTVVVGICFFTVLVITCHR